MADEKQKESVGVPTESAAGPNRKRRRPNTPPDHEQVNTDAPTAAAAPTAATTAAHRSKSETKSERRTMSGGVRWSKAEANGPGPAYLRQLNKMFGVTNIAKVRIMHEIVLSSGERNVCVCVCGCRYAAKLIIAIGKYVVDGEDTRVAGQTKSPTATATTPIPTRTMPDTATATAAASTTPATGTAAAASASTPTATALIVGTTAVGPPPQTATARDDHKSGGRPMAGLGRLYVSADLKMERIIVNAPMLQIVREVCNAPRRSPSRP